ncbi:hypothetical protein STA3757_28730 [Stanieria sp. NIES-3757]|nr:hypothetical protein STA3757_28730 [Stanieria sp. NIES-3757]
MAEEGKLNRYKHLIFSNPIDFPETSCLYSLESIAVGTPYTESLSSYLNRLAQEHCVTPQKLIMGEIAPTILGDKYAPEIFSKNVSSLFGNSDAKPAINGMREMTRSLVDALEKLTLRQDLRFLSCVTWKGIISDRGLFRQYKAWCPLCFETWRQARKLIYEPLLWSFREVDFCPEHQCELCDRCPHCDSFQKAISDFSVPGYCSRCRHWLGKSDNTKSSLQEDFKQNHFILQGIGDLIALTPQLKHQPNLKSLKHKFKLILFCFERAIHHDLGQYVVLIKLIEKLKIDLKQNYFKPINLTEIIIPVCQQAKISVSQLFENNYENLAQILAQNIETDYKIL